MVALSKELFDRNIGNLKCHQMMHPWTENCFKAAVYHLSEGFKGTVRFYSIVYMAHLLLNRKNISQKFIKQTMLQYSKSVLFGASYFLMYATSNCIVRNTLGYFPFYSFAGFSSFIGGTSIFLEDHTRRGITIITFFYMALDIMFRRLVERKVIIRTKNLETVLFMTISTALLYVLRKTKNLNTSLWLFVPPYFNPAENNTKCPHLGSCVNDIAMSGFKYFIVGVLFQTVRSLIPKIKKITKQPGVILESTAVAFKMGVFTGLYVATYKAVSCSLCRYRGKDSVLHTIPAGLIAGTVYRTKPDLNVVVIALANLILVTLKALKMANKIPQLPYSEFIYMLSCGYLFHSRIAVPWCCPSHLISLMSSFTNTQSDQIYERLQKFAQSSDKPIDC